MKIMPRQIDGFVKKPDPAARAVLVYGPDEGLVRERAKAIGLTAVADLNDPFNAVTLSGDVLVSDPARLADEAMAQSLMGGSRLIRIEDAGDKLALLFKEYLAAPSMQNLVVLEAGELGKSSPLRKIFENAPNAAVIPCYIEDERDLAPLIRTALTETGYRIEPDALQLMAASITGDRAQVRSEIEKLITYMGKKSSVVTLEDVQQSCGDTGMQTMDNLVFAVAGGNTEAALRAFGALMREGTGVIGVLRALQTHFRRLHIAKCHAAQGLDVKEIMSRRLAPPVFYKNETPFAQQMNRWPLASLEKIMLRLSQIEAQCKQTGIPDETLCSQAILAISRGAKAA